MPTQEQLREQITAQVIAALESGDVPPWRRPWRLGKNAGAPANVVCKRGYRGLNLLLLDVAATRHNLSSRWWGTFNQWKATGRQGDATTRPMSRRQVGNSDRLLGSRRQDQVKTRTVSRKKTGSSSCGPTRCSTSIKSKVSITCEPVSLTPVETTVIDYEPAEQAVEASLLGMGLSLRYGGGKAFYCPSQDYVQIPPKATFESLDEYYGTVFHELVHATEHESRLNWSRKDRENAYALGELIAEIGRRVRLPGAGSSCQ